MNISCLSMKAWLSIRRFVALPWLLVLAAAAGPASGGNPWASFASPGSGKAEAIGQASAGCVDGAQELPLDGTGYRVMRPSRNRRFGHPELVEFVQTLGRQITEKGIGTLLVGDLSQPRGGPMSSMHRSHQSGLDVDLWFWLPQGISNRVLTSNEREKWSAPSMLAADGVKLHPRQWTTNQQELLHLAAQHPDVDRVFVNPAIKRELCHSQAGSPWLHKVRPWWGHDDHLHVRLRCPPADTRCVPQEPIPSSNGCDASLNWWFTAEAKQRPTGPPPSAPELPAACLALLNGH